MGVDAEYETVHNLMGARDDMKAQERKALQQFNAFVLGHAHTNVVDQHAHNYFEKSLQQDVATMRFEHQSDTLEATWIPKFELLKPNVKCQECRSRQFCKLLSLNSTSHSPLSRSISH